MTEERTTLRPIASYEAAPGEVGRVLLLYSGGLDTSVMLKWIQDEYEAEVVALTVNLGQPGEDFDVVRGKALKLGALDCHLVDAREQFAEEYVLPAIKANALYGGGYPLFTALGRPLIATPGRGEGARDGLRHDRPRLHGQGQRPGPDRVHRARPGARAEDHRAGAGMADGPRGGDRLRPRARHPGEGRHRGAAVLDRRQPLGALVRGRRDRGPGRAAARRRVPARHRARRTPPTRRGTWWWSSSAGARWRSTASGSASWTCSSGPRSWAPGTAWGSWTTWRTGSWA